MHYFSFCTNLSLHLQDIDRQAVCRKTKEDALCFSVVTPKMDEPKVKGKERKMEKRKTTKLTSKMKKRM